MPAVMHEEAHQIALFRWVEFSRSKHPHLKWLAAIPNGGFRHKATAGKLKAQGVKAGVPDLQLLVPRNGFHGLHIELKKPASPGKRAGVTSPAQREWIAFLREQGFRVEVAFGWEEAAKILVDYLS